MAEITRARGRPARHTYRADNPIQISAVSMTLDHIKRANGWDNNTIRKELIEFGSKIPNVPTDTFFKEFSANRNFDYRTEQIAAICQGEVKNDDVFKAILLWLKSNEKYNNMLIYFTKGAELNSREPFVKSARNLLGFNDPLDQSDADAYAGTYRLYRPFFRNPTEQIILCKLVVGGESAFDCSLTSVYYDGKKRIHHSVGKIILHGTDRNKFTAFTSGVGKGRSTFLLHFDDLKFEDDGLYEMGGNMIASYGSDPSSAWPFFAIKSSGDEWEPEVIQGKEFQNLPDLVKERLDRGAVYWRPDQFPRPFSSKFPA